jgi:spore maturation protein B
MDLSRGLGDVYKRQIFGSTETTFYVIAVYFGSVAVRRARHAVAAGLVADFVGVVASVIICQLMFG